EREGACDAPRFLSVRADRAWRRARAGRGAAARRCGHRRRCRLRQFATAAWAAAAVSVHWPATAAPRQSSARRAAVPPPSPCAESCLWHHAPRQQDKEARMRFHPARRVLLRRAEAEEDVGARRSADRAARVLSDIEIGEAIAGNEYRYAERMDGGIDRDAATRRQGDAFAARRTKRALADRLFAEEDERGVVLHRRAGAGWMRRQPGADRLHRDVLALERTARDQASADRRIGLAVLAGIGDAQHPSIVEPHPARALDVQKKHRDRIVAPEQHARAGRGMIVDLGS